MEEECENSKKRKKKKENEQTGNKIAVVVSEICKKAREESKEISKVRQKAPDIPNKIRKILIRMKPIGFSKQNLLKKWQKSTELRNWMQSN